MGYKPSDYGTVDTTGAASSRAAIQGAIDAAAAAGGGTVLLPSGTLLLDNSLNITSSGITLVGEGYGTLLTVAGSVANKHVIWARGTSGTPIRGVGVFGLRVQGHGDNSGTTADRHGIYAQWCDWLKVSDVWAHDCTFAALKIDDSEHAVVSDFTVVAGSRGTTGGWYGIELANFNKGAGARGYSGHHSLTNITTHTPEHSIAVYLCDDVTIDNVTATGGQNDYTFNWTGAQRITLNNFTCLTNGGAYLYTENDVTLGTNRVCADLVFSNGFGKGIITAAAVQIRDLHGVYLTYSADTRLVNLSLDCSTQTGTVDGINADTNSPRLRVQNCNVVSPIRDGIRVNADGAFISQTRVNASRSNSATGGGINLTAGQYHLVQGCRVEGSSGNGIYVGNAYVNLADNVVSGCALDGIVSNGADTMMRNNFATTCTNYGIRTTSSALRTRLVNNFTITNTAGNYSISGSQSVMDRTNRGMTADSSTRVSSFVPSWHDYIVVVDANAAGRTVTLPGVSTLPNGKVYVFKCKAGSANSVTINPNAGDTIDGSSSLILSAGQVAWLVGDGTNLWNAI